jgi:exopolysaccharide biosynthesis protein
MIEVKPKKKIYKLTIVFIVLDFLALVCFGIVYFLPSFKTTIVTTAFRTMTHKYIAYIFYSQKMIDKVFASNYYVPIDEEVNLDDIVIDTKDKETYDSPYDEAILKRDKNADYKIIDVEVGNSNGFLVAIYDPSRVRMMTKEILNTRGKGERTLDMCNRYGGLVCINGGGFLEVDGWGIDTPMGYVINNGQIIYSAGYNPNANLIAMTYDNKLLLTTDSAENAIQNSNIRDALEFGPFLIVNGTPMTIKGDGGLGKSPRAVIAQRKDGIILFLIVDGSALYIDGAEINDLIELLLKYGAHNAANLDGGNSTTLIVNGVTHNKLMPNAAKSGGRYVVNGWALLPKNSGVLND